MRDYTTSPIVAKTRELMAQGLDLDQLAVALGVSRRTAVDYRSRVRRADGDGCPNYRGKYSRKYTKEQARCPRCELRGEHICLPESATAYLGRSGEPAACAAVMR